MSSAASPPILVPGDVLDDRFVIEAPTGRGGLGVVFRGWDLEQEVPVAIKLLAALTPTDVLRFRREASLLATLRLAGVVRYIAHGDTEAGVPYLVMEWLDGNTVATTMERRGFSTDEAVALVRATCRPLGALHDSGLVHRDLKPENLVMAGDDPSTVVLIDLGLARTAVSLAGRVTATGVALGTPGYMAPEQVRGEPEVDGRADVFALGCVLYELVTGFAPFSGDNALAVRTKILLTTPPPLGVLCPEVPDGLEAVVMAMIGKRLDQRLATAAAVDAALAALGPIPPGPRRSWNPARPPTLRQGPAVTARAAVWGGVVMVETAIGIDALRATVAPLPAEVEIVEASTLAVHVPPAATLADIAPRLASAARAIRAHDPRARIVVRAGRDELDALIDAAAVTMVQASRVSLFDRDATDLGFVFVDDATAQALLDAGFQLERDRTGYRLA